MGRPDRSASFSEAGKLLAEIARVDHWAGLYRDGHPFYRERVRSLHASLARFFASEPSGRLLFGIARDKILYRDVYLDEGQQIVSNFAVRLYLRGVATLAIGADAGPADLESLFRVLHAFRPGERETPIDQVLRNEGAQGIALYPHKYKELFSREPAGPGGESPFQREDAVWRLLLAASLDGDEGDEQLLDAFAEWPELIPAIISRLGPERTDTLLRLFRKMGGRLSGMPPERRTRVLSGLEEGAGLPADPEERETLLEALAAVLAEERPDDDLLELIALLMARGPGETNRLLAMLRRIALERDARRSLRPLVARKIRDSLRRMDLPAVARWEELDRMLPPRDGDDSREVPASAGGPEGPPDAALLEAFREGELLRDALLVRMEILAREKDDEEFHLLAEEIRDRIPRLLQGGHFGQLRPLASPLHAMEAEFLGGRRNTVRQVIGEIDTTLLIDIHFSDRVRGRGAEELEGLMISFAREIIHPLLDRLASEQDRNRRKAILGLAARLGADAVPGIKARMKGSRWYLVRNLCHLLGEIGDGRGTDALLDALRGSDVRVRRQAVIALGKIRAAEAAEPLAGILLAESVFHTAKDDALRVEAATALARIGGAEAMSALYRGRNARREPVRQHCAALLGNPEAP